MIHAPAENKLTARDLVLPGLFIGATCVFVLRLWYLQVVATDEMRSQAGQMSRKEYRRLAPRGKIVDRNGQVLADILPQTVVLVNPGAIAEHPESLEKLAPLLGTTVKKLERAMKIGWRGAEIPVPVFVGTTPQQAVTIAEAGDSLPGVSIETQAMRVYRDTTSAPHVLGFVSVPTSSILEEFKAKSIEAQEYVGRDGLERRYEERLMGRPGVTAFTVDPAGKPVRGLPGEEPVPGDTLILGLDTELQSVAAQALGKSRGAVVMLDPTNGEVLCMVSSPTYDIATLTHGMSEEEAAYLYQNESRPMLKRAVSGIYPPGSSFKIVTTLGSYAAGTFDNQSAFFCPGYLTVGTKKVRCENHPVGSYNFFGAMTKSCNTFFGKMAQREGADALRDTARQIGLGKKTGIDLGGESPGRIPTDEFVQKAHGRRWSLGDTNNIGIGQGDIEVTPLQMACVASLVANEGVSYRPHLVRAFLAPGDGAMPEMYEPDILARFDADAQFWSTLKSALRNVVVAGTARRAQVSGVEVSGKTGSAENSQGRSTHAWFVGYAPADNPKIAFAVVVENGGHGGEVAAPIAKRVLDAFFGKKSKPQSPSNRSVSVAIVPDSDSGEPVDEESR